MKFLNKVKAAPWHADDALLDMMTFQELIDTVYSNVKDINEASIRKEFEELLDLKVKDAKFMIGQHMKEIMDALK